MENESHFNQVSLCYYLKFIPMAIYSSVIICLSVMGFMNLVKVKEHKLEWGTCSREPAEPAYFHTGVFGPTKGK